MALLRDARTSATILEGTPEEVALVAAELDAGTYLFDDVGLSFDADAVRKAHADRVAGFEASLAAAKAAKAPDAERVSDLEAAVADARASIDAAPALAEQAAAAATAAQAELEN